MSSNSLILCAKRVKKLERAITALLAARDASEMSNEVAAIARLRYLMSQA